MSGRPSTTFGTSFQSPPDLYGAVHCYDIRDLRSALYCFWLKEPDVNIHLQNKVILYFFSSPLRSQFPKRGSPTSSFGLACCLFFFFFSQALHIAFFLSHLVKCYHSVVYEKRGGIKKHTNTLTSPRPNKCRLDPTRHIVKTHLSSVHNPSCVNQMITPCRENFRVQR